MSEGSTEEIINDLFEKEDDELYEKIGRELQGTSVFPPTTHHLIEVARSWMQGKRKEIAKKVCFNTPIKNIAKMNIGDEKVVLTLAVSELVSSITTGVSPITVSVLIVKEGLKQLCGDVWRNSSSGA